MEILLAIFLGILQGITELFPISSSGHLLVIPEIIQAIDSDLDFGFQDTSFDVVLHIATFLAIAIFYRKKVVELLSNPTKGENKRYLKNITITSGTVITLGLLFYLIVGESLARNSVLTASMLILFGILLIAVEIYSNKKSEYTQIEDLNSKKALFVGALQGLSFIRGVSRSGSAVIAGILSGMNKKEALDYAFISGLPVFAALTVFQTTTMLFDPDSYKATALELGAGFVAAFTSGIISIALFRKFIEYKWSLSIFGIYRILLGIVALIIIL
jgi:undecaprenyl-diphosphatase